MARVGGKQGALFLNLGGVWSFVADIYDWECSYEMVTLDASVKGDLSERLMISHGRGKLTAKRFVEAGGGWVLAALATPGVRLDWAVTAVDSTVPPNPANFTTNTSGKVQGTGYVTRTTTQAPRGMVRDDWELTLDTLPVFS